MGVKVLLADSSVSNHKVVELAISERDVELVAVTDGNEALERVRELRPDIVLADIELPRMDGYSLCETIKGDPELSHAKIFLLKTSFASYDQDRANNAGAEGMLEKPFSPSALLNVIDTGVREFTGKSTPPAEPGEAAESEEEPLSVEVSDEVSFADLEMGDQATTAEISDEPLELREDMPPAAAEPSATVEYPDTTDRMEDLVIDTSEEVPAAEIAAPVPTEVETPVEAVEKSHPKVDNAVPLAVDEGIAETPLEISLEEAEEPVATPAPVESVIEPEPEPVVYDRGERDPAVEMVTQKVVERLGLSGIHALDEETAEKLGRDLVEEIVRKLSDEVIREVAWEVVPDLAERMIRDAIEEITKT